MYNRQYSIVFFYLHFICIYFRCCFSFNNCSLLLGINFDCNVMSHVLINCALIRAPADISGHLYRGIGHPLGRSDVDQGDEPGGQWQEGQRWGQSECRGWTSSEQYHHKPPGNTSITPHSCSPNRQVVIITTCHIKFYYIIVTMTNIICFPPAFSPTICPPLPPPPPHLLTCTVPL